MNWKIYLSLTVLLAIGAVAFIFRPHSPRIEHVEGNLMIVRSREINLLPLVEFELSSRESVTCGSESHHVTKLGFVMIDDVTAYRFK